MRNSDWIALFRRIPQAMHDNLTLTAANGVELSLQSIFRLEDEYMVVRGRLGGTTETGRVLVIPYDQITFMNFTRPVSEGEVRAIYGEATGESPTVALERKGDTEVMPSRDGLPAEPAKAAETPGQQSMKTPLPPPGRPNLVDRLRNRPVPPQQKPPSR